MNPGSGSGTPEHRGYSDPWSRASPSTGWRILGPPRPNPRLVLAGLLLLWSTPASAATWTVGSSGIEDFSTPQAALVAAANGDEIVVSKGDYFGPIDFFGKSIILRGAGGRGVTRLHVGCGNFRLNLTGVAGPGGLRELTVVSICSEEDPIATAPTVHLLNSTARISEVVFHSTGAYPLFLAQTTQFEVVDVAFLQQGDSSIESVLFPFSDVVIDRVLVAGEGPVAFFDGSSSGFVTITNTVFNAPTPGSVISYVGNRPFQLPHLFQNLTIAQGEQTFTSLCWNCTFDLGDSQSGPLLTNSILAGSETAIFGATVAAPLFAPTYNDAWPDPGGTVSWSPESPDWPTGIDGNISADPQWVAYTDDGDWTNDNFCLQAGSPGIDTGDPDPAWNDTDGTRNDLGAFGGPGAPPCEYMADVDGDGFMPIAGDCAGNDPTIYPDAPGEVDCDGIDTDCDTFDGGEPCGDDDDSAPGDDDDSAPIDDDDDDSASMDDDDSAPGDDDDSVVGDDDDSTAPPSRSCSCRGSLAHSSAAGILPALLAATARRRRRR